MVVIEHRSGRPSFVRASSKDTAAMEHLRKSIQEDLDAMMETAFCRKYDLAPQLRRHP